MLYSVGCLIGVRYNLFWGLIDSLALLLAVVSGFYIVL